MDARGVRRRPSAIAGQQRADARPRHEVRGQLGVERRQRHGGIPQQLHRHAPGAEQDRRPEDRIARHAEDQFLPVGTADHRLQREAVDRRVRRRRRDPPGDRPRRVPRLGGRRDVEHHAADVRLVGDVPRQQLDHQPPAGRKHLRRQSFRLLRRSRDAGLRNRDAIGGEDGLRLRLGQHPAGRRRPPPRRPRRPRRGGAPPHPGRACRGRAPSAGPPAPGPSPSGGRPRRRPPPGCRSSRFPRAAAPPVRCAPPPRRASTTAPACRRSAPSRRAPRPRAPPPRATPSPSGSSSPGSRPPPGSAATASSAAAKRAGGASPTMSTGLPRLQSAGSAASSRASVSAESSARFAGPSISRSTASTPAPPPLVTIATRARWSGRNRATVSAAANISASPRTRRMPARRSAASRTSSEPESAPVCVAAARAAAAERPALSATTGFSRAAARAADRNLRACGTLSR